MCEAWFDDYTKVENLLTFYRNVKKARYRGGVFLQCYWQDESAIIIYGLFLCVTDGITKKI